MGAIVSGGLTGLLNQSSAQVIDGSLVFDHTSSQYLKRTPSSNGNQKTWTWSCWLRHNKKTGQSGAASQSFLISTNSGAAAYLQIYFSTEQLVINTKHDGGSFTSTKPTRLFRDLSGWYHIVYAVDTTQATGTDRLKIYINGELLSSFTPDGRANITQNTDIALNSTTEHNIGKQYGNSVYSDFNMSQVYLIDGQALGPGYFGFTDPLTNTWRPKKYTGVVNAPASSGGTLANYNSNTTLPVYINQGGGGTPGGSNKPVSNAFDGDASTYCDMTYLTGQFSKLTFATPITNVTNITIGYDGEGDPGYNGGNVQTSISFNGSRQSIQIYNGGAITLTDLYFISQAGNGVCRLYDVTITTSSASATELTLITTPAGVNGFYLPMDGNSPIGEDKSGNGNNWILQNFSGTFNDPDVLKDSPSGAVSGGRAQTGITTTSSAPSNYATLNPLSLTNTLSLSDGNLDYTATSAANNECFSNIRLNGGKFYFESNLINAADVPGSTSFRFGICKNLSGSNIIIYNATGNFETLGTTDSSPPSYTAGNIIGVAVDCVNGSIQFFKDGVSVGTKTFTVGTDEWTSYIRVYKGGGNTVNGTINFGQKPFKYAPPQGYLPLNSASATPETVITRPDQYVGATTWSGNDSNPRLISTPNLKPDLVWIKTRDAGYHHGLFDSVRGAGGAKRLYSDEAYAEGGTGGAEGTAYGELSAFNNGGFTVNTGTTSDIWVNNNGTTYVAWTWKAGGNKNTFNVDDVGYASAASVNMSVGSLSNKTQLWSGLFTLASGSFDQAITNAFNGSISESTRARTSGNAVLITMTLSTPVTVSSEIKVFGETGYDSTCTVTVGGITYTSSSGSVHTFNVSGSLTRMTLVANGGSGRTYFEGMEIDSKILVDSNVSVNVPSIANTGASVGTRQGFSIVGFTDGGSACSIAHGLTKAPDFYIVKFRGATGNWSIYHKSLGNTKRLKFTTDNSGSADAGWWQNTSPTSSLFYLGGNLITSTTQIAYLWHDVPGLQKFGSYVGNGDNDGTFVELGFRPTLIWIKDTTNNGESWNIHDTARVPINPNSTRLIIDGSGAEATNAVFAVDMISNGFKFRTGNDSHNQSSRTYIYCAWAESPVSNLYGGQSNAR